MYEIKISSRTLHFITPAGTSRGIYTTRKSFYITLSDTNKPGVIGIGECATLPDLSCDAMSDDEYERKLRIFCDDFLSDYIRWRNRCWKSWFKCNEIYRVGKCYPCNYQRCLTSASAV